MVDTWVSTLTGKFVLLILGSRANGPELVLPRWAHWCRLTQIMGMGQCPPQMGYRMAGHEHGGGIGDSQAG